MHDAPGSGWLERNQSGRHPVADLLVRAWRGPREPVDGSWHRVQPWHPTAHAVVAVTASARRTTRA